MNMHRQAKNGASRSCCFSRYIIYISLPDVRFNEHTTCRQTPLEQCKNIQYNAYLFRAQRQGICLRMAGATANVLRYELDLRFQGHAFWNVNSSKTLSAIQKCSSMTFIEVDICYKIGPFRVLYSVTLTFIFQGQTFFCYAFMIKKCAGNGCPRQIYLYSHGPAVKLPMLIDIWRIAELRRPNVPNFGTSRWVWFTDEFPNIGS